MRRVVPLLPLLAAILSFAPAEAAAQEASASWLRSKTAANVLNPKISAIGDFLGRTGPERADGGMLLRETEIAIQSEIDPFSRLDLYVTKPDGEPVEIEEGYVTLTTLPLGLQGRGGKFRPAFGRLNMTHTHELPFVNAPLALSSILGPEGLNGTGAELSKLFAPFGFFTELSYGFLDDLGEAAEEEPATVDVVPAARRFRDFAHVARLRTYADITDTTNVEAGVSGAIHQPSQALHRKMAGADLTFRWKPLAEGLYKAFIWRTELILSQRTLPAEFDELAGTLTLESEQTHRRGGYSYVSHQFARRWSAGVLGDYAENPAVRKTRSVTRAVAPFLTFQLSEFNRFRVQYEYRRTTARADEHRGYLQWTVVVGPHGAHPF